MSKRSSVRQRKRLYVVIAVVCLVAVIVLAVFLVSRGGLRFREVASPSQGSTSSSVGTSSTGNVKDLGEQFSYAGWPEYCSKQEKACFRYPPDWNIDAKQNATVDPDGDGLDLVSKSGTMVSFRSSISSLGGGCELDKVPHIFFQEVRELPKQAGFYIVTYTYGNTPEAKQKPFIALIDAREGVPKVGDTGWCMYYPLFNARNTPGSQSWFGSVNTWVRQEDIQTVLLMLESYRY